MIDPHIKAEKNARFKERGNYHRWLIQQNGTIPLIELADEPDPISLRQIYIPIRLGKKDIDDSEMNSPERFDEEKEDNQIGQNSFDEVLNHEFLIVSGRPGAGKTTFIKALVNELCGDYHSRFNDRMQERFGNVFVIPIILRELPNIASCKKFSELLGMWWERQVELNQLQDTVQPLNVEKLNQSIEFDDLTCLVLFDGIDEIGSLETRHNIYQIAHSACNEGCRIILTGRPSGLSDLENMVLPKAGQTWGKDDGRGRLFKERWRFVLPLTRPQIDSFIVKWYQLRPEWVSRFQVGTDDFRQALSDSSRPHLLSLARRPIFLALMSLVHCTRNKMPHGRAALYRAIVDLYLERQQRNRRLKERPDDGEAMPQWSSSEPRLALGYLAWLSMQKGSKQDRDKSDERRIVWEKSAMLEALRNILGGKNPRFTEVLPEHAESLLKYYLYPAGLLIEPAEGYVQFAHLSFQEYLCAEYLQGRMIGRRMEKEWRDQIAGMLYKPGWYEVALLLLAVHAERTQNQGHFELLGLLDLSDYYQARLFYLGLLGRELPIDPEERHQWLPVLFIAALVHPLMGEISMLEDWQALNETGLALLEKLFANLCAETQWLVLMGQLETDMPVYFQDYEEDEWEEWQANLKKRWLQPQNDDSWEVEFGEQEARNHALLHLTTVTQWGVDFDDHSSPLRSSKLLEGLNKVCAKESWLWQKNSKEKWVNSSSLLYSEDLFSLDDMSHYAIQKNTPLSVWLMQGESIDFTPSDGRSLPSVLHAIHSNKAVPIARIRLALAFYQWQQFLELSYMSDSFEERSQLLAQSLSQSLSWKRLHSHSRPRSRLLSELGSKSRLQSRSLSLSLSLSRSRSRSRSRQLSLSRQRRIPPLPWYNNHKELFNQARKLLDNAELGNDVVIPVLMAFSRYAYHFAAWNWFTEQSENPELWKSRGGHVGEPLPKVLGLFGNDGLPSIQQKRESLVRLQQWAENDDNWVEWVFPEGLCAKEKTLLRSDIAELKTHDWSPYGFMQAVLDDWPENVAVQDWDIEKSERELVEACEQLLVEHSSDNQPKSE